MPEPPEIASCNSSAIGHESQDATSRVLRADERFTTTADGIATHHCFSFGDHYDPDNTGFAALQVVNEEVVAPGAGYEPHRHSDVEIVTWVLEGALRHEDSAGSSGTIAPGQVQHLSAGRGVEHSEHNASDVHPLRYIQMRLAPDARTLAEPPTEPTYAQVAVDATPGVLHETLPIRNMGAALSVAYLGEGDAVALPAGAVHLHLTRGAARFGDISLGPGDTLRLGESHGAELSALGPSEALVWSFDKES